VRELCARGAAVNAVAEGGLTALHAAAASGLSGAVCALLEAGARAMAADDERGWTPLALAAWARVEASVRALLAHGADASAVTTGANLRALDVAAMQDSACCVRALVDAAPGAVDKVSAGAFTALHLACAAGAASAVRELVARGADMKVKAGEVWPYARSGCYGSASDIAEWAAPTARRSSYSYRLSPRDRDAKRSHPQHAT